MAMMSALRIAFAIAPFAYGVLLPVPLFAETGAPAAAAGATVSGVLRDERDGTPLTGLSVLLGGAQRVTTGPDGRFRFNGVATGVYRLIVPGACDRAPMRVEVRPGEPTELEASADTSCAHPGRFYEARQLPPGAQFTPWPVAVARDVALRDLVLPLLDVVAEAVESDSSFDAVLVAPQGIKGELQRSLPRARPKAAGEDWVSLIEPGCFAPSIQLTLTEKGKVFLRLLGSALDPDAPLLRREACEGCVKGLFSDLRRSGLARLSGLYAAPQPDTGERTLAGVLNGEPFFVRTTGISLALVEAFRTRMLDLCGYSSCIDTREMPLFAVELGIDAPDSVVAGGEFEVRVRVSAPETLPGAAVRLEVEGANRVGGEGAKAGILEPNSPLVVVGRYRAPRTASWERGPRGIVVRARFAAEYGVPRDPEGAIAVRKIRVR